MRKLYIHAGLNKTGSTSLQLFLIDQKDWLKTQGFCYPDLGNTFIHDFKFKTTSGNLADLREKYFLYKNDIVSFSTYIDDFASSLNKYSAELPDNVSIILSSEFLCALPESFLSIIHKTLAIFFDIKIIFFERDSYSWLISAISESIKGVRYSGNLLFRDCGKDIFFKFLEPLLLEKKLLAQKICYIKLKYKSNIDVIEIFLKALNFSLPSNYVSSDYIANTSDKEYSLLNLVLNRFRVDLNTTNKLVKIASSEHLHTKKLYFYSDELDKKIDEFYQLNNLRRDKNVSIEFPKISDEEELLKDAHISLNLLNKIVSTINYDKYHSRINRLFEIVERKIFFTSSYFINSVPHNFDCIAYLIN